MASVIQPRHEIVGTAGWNQTTDLLIHITSCAAFVFCAFQLHLTQFESAIGVFLGAAAMRAVNDTKDNDTIAAIVGAAVAAFHAEHVAVIKQEAQPVNAIVDVIRRPDVDLDSGIGQITVNPGTDKEMHISLSVILPRFYCI
jgi:hypothetical protein